MEFKETENKLPSIEKIQELCKFIKKPLNNLIVLFNPVAPMVSNAGLTLTKEVQEKNQKLINNKGLVVVYDHEESDIKAGDRVVLQMNSQPALQKVVNTKEIIDNLLPNVKEDFLERKGRFATFNEQNRPAYYKRYVVLFIHPMSLAAVLNNPKEDTTEDDSFYDID